MWKFQADLVHILHDRRVHGEVEEALVLLSLLGGDHLRLPCLGDVVVQDGDKSLESGLFQDLLVYEDKQRFRGHVTAFPLSCNRIS